MKVILKQEVDNLGLAGDVVDVKDGYGRNFLIPRGMAILATKGAMKEAETLLRTRKAHEAKTLDSAQQFKDILEAKPLQIKVRVDERGHLYGSVAVGDVHRVLRDRGHQIEKKRIDLKGTIKELGTYEVPVQVHPQVAATVTIEILDEEGKVLAGAELPEPEPLPGQMAEGEQAAEGEAADESVDALVEQAIEAAEAFEAEKAAAEADAEADAAAAAQDDDADDTADAADVVSDES